MRVAPLPWLACALLPWSFGCSPVYADAWTRSTGNISMALGSGESRVYAIHAVARGDPKYIAYGHVELQYWPTIALSGGGHADGFVRAGHHLEVVTDCSGVVSATEGWNSETSPAGDALASVGLGEDGLPFELECDVVFTAVADAPARDGSGPAAKFWWTAKLSVFADPLDELRFEVEEQ